MSKTFRAYEPDQVFLMPASMREWLPSNHVAYFISDVVDQLDLSAMVERYTHDGESIALCLLHRRAVFS